MTTDAQRSVMPESASPQAAEPPRQDGASNLYAPISIENRITGQTRVRRQRAQAQLTPGSSYDYGRFAYGEPSDRPESLLREEDAFGYQKSMPPTFLRRTMISVDQPSPPPTLWGFGPRGVPSEGSRPAGLTSAETATGGAATSLRPTAAPMGGFAVRPAPLAYTAATTAFDAQLPMGGAQVPAPSALSGANSIQSVSFAQSEPSYAQGVTQPVFPSQGTATARQTPVSAIPIAQNGAATESSPSQAATAGGYLPRHGRAAPERAVERARAPEPVYDPWEAMGWKAPEKSAFENTAVFRLSDLTMFERDAFQEPPNPYSDPSMGAQPYGTPTGDLYCVHSLIPSADPAAGLPYSANVAAELYNPDRQDAGNPYDAPAAMGMSYDNPADAGRPYDPYAAAELYPNPDARAYQTSAPDQAYPYEGRLGEPGEESHGFMGAPERAPAASGRNRAVAAQPKRTPPRKRFGINLAALGPVRSAVLIGTVLALLFCGIEGYKLVQNLLEGEKENNEYRSEYYKLTGQNLDQLASGVELLPAGQTYTPTASPVPAQTPTPSPRVNQNDPLIGVMDSGGVTATPFKSALPTPTAITRTRLAQYPDNPLLTISDTFATLRQENPDVVGRLTIDGLLEELFVQRNNTFYLTHNVRGVFGSGAVFVDEGVVLKKPPENLLLRGQITTAGKLFEPLTQYGSGGADFVQKHGIITCDTLYEQARYVVFAVVHADSRANSADYFNYAGYPTFQSDSQMLGYVQAAKKRSVYAIDVGVQPGDRLLTLATLSEGNNTDCWVILCRMLRNGEANGNIQRQ